MVARLSWGGVGKALLRWHQHFRWAFFFFECQSIEPSVRWHSPLWKAHTRHNSVYTCLIQRYYCLNRHSWPRLEGALLSILCCSDCNTRTHTHRMMTVCLAFSSLFRQNDSLTFSAHCPSAMLPCARRRIMLRASMCSRSSCTCICAVGCMHACAPECAGLSITHVCALATCHVRVTFLSRLLRD